jgi:hypothetical protein
MYLLFTNSIPFIKKILLTLQTSNTLFNYENLIDVTAIDLQNIPSNTTMYIRKRSYIFWSEFTIIGPSFNV